MDGTLARNSILILKYTFSFLKEGWREGTRVGMGESYKIIFFPLSVASSSSKIKQFFSEIFVHCNNGSLIRAQLFKTDDVIS